MESEDLKTAQWVWEQARRHKADDVSVQISREHEMQAAVRVGKLEKLQQARRQSLTMSVYKNGRFAQNVTNDLRTDQLKSFIENAVTLAGYLPQDKFRLLPDPAYYPTLTDPGLLELVDADYKKLTIDDLISTARTIDEALSSKSEKLISSNASITGVFGQNSIFNSNGLAVTVEGTSYAVYVSASVRDGDRGRPEYYWYGASRRRSELPAAEELASEVAAGTLAKIGQQRIASGKYDLLVDNLVGDGLLQRLIDAMNAAKLQQHRSFLEGKIGSRIASEHLDITDDPSIKRAIGSRFFDGEGLGAKRRVMVESGILREYYVDSYYGRKLGLTPTSGSISNLVIKCGKRTRSEIIGQIKRGVLVTDFIGGNSNPTTGDFSLGIAGQLIEDGAITKPVSSMNISGNLSQLWNRLVETGNDPFIYSQYRTPSMLFEGVNFSGI